MSIIIDKVRFRNFLSFGSRWQEIDFKTGVNVVLGLDVDKDKSNGAGKSSFLETIPFALFGQTHKPVKKDDIINWKNRRACLVELNFRKGENQYFVRRGIKPNVLEIYENDVLIDRPAHLRDYQAILEGIIGLNFQTFMSLIHSNINSSMPVLAMKKPEKRKFIEKVFGLELYSWLNEKANEKLRSVNDRIREYQIKTEANNDRATTIVGNIASLEAKIRQTSSTELELRDKSEHLKSLLDKFEGIDELDDIRDSISAKTSLKLELQILIDKIKNKNLNHIHFKVMPQFEMALESLNNEMKKLEEMETDRENLKKLYGKHTSIDDLEKKYNKENSKLNEIGEKLKQVHDDIVETKSSIREHANMIKRNDDNLLSLRDGSICPTCGQKIKDVPEDHIKEIEEENETLKNFIIQHKKEIESYKEREENLRNEIEEKRKYVRELDDDWRWMFNIENTLSHAPKVNPEHITFFENKIAKYDRVVKNLKRLINKFEHEIRKLSTDVSLLEERKSHLDQQYREIQEVEGIIDRLEEKVQMESENKIEFQEMLEREKRNSISIRSENEKLKEKTEFHKGLIDYFESIKWVCKDENIKRFAISYMMPYLNSRVNHYLSEVGYGFYASIDNWLDVTIKGPGVPNGSYGSLSGGESRGIDLALQFAIHDVARLRSGIWPDLIVMDEILDSSIDSKGIEKLMNIISIRQQEEGSKIFIISHREEIGESFDADNTYFVTKQEGYSRVEIQ